MFMRTGNPENARGINRALVLGYLRGHGAASRTEIAGRLKLSKATVTNVVNELVASALVSETGKGESSEIGGRRPVMLSLDTARWFVLGLDLGTTNMVAAIASLRGESIAKQRVRTTRDHRVSSIIAQVTELVDGLMRHSRIGREKVVGMGMAVAGTVDKSAGVIEFSPNFNWRRVHINQLMFEKTGIPTIADNCTRVMTLGETWYGRGKGIRNLVYINIGFGIGSALLINGELYEGHSEFGHLILSDEKIRCGCGHYGCLEAVASGHAIERQASQSIIIEDGEWVTAQTVAEMARGGNPVAQGIFEGVGRHLGRGIAYTANILCPQKIIIGGGVALAGSTLLTPVLKAFDGFAMEAVRGKTEVLLSSLGMDAGVLGAIAMALNDTVFQRHTRIS